MIIYFKENEDEGDESVGKLTGTEFEDIDLSDLEWVEFDEVGGVSCMVSEFQSRFVVIKPGKKT